MDSREAAELIAQQGVYMPCRIYRLAALILFCIAGCQHRGGASKPSQHGYQIETLDTDVDDGVRIKGNSATARIWVLIGKGQFAEAEVLIAEGLAGGLLSRPEATRMLDRIALLNTRLREIPASLQRTPNFPSQLRDFTLFEINQMRDRQDYSLATRVQLDMVKKLLQEPERLMEKIGKVR